MALMAHTIIQSQLNIQVITCLIFSRILIQLSYATLYLDAKLWFLHVSGDSIALFLEAKYVEKYEPTLKEMAAERLLEYEVKPFTFGSHEHTVTAAVIEIHLK